MGERGKLTFLFVLSSFLAFSGYILSRNDIRIFLSDLYADYNAVFYISDDIYLEEEYIYHPEGNKFSMLFRNWRVPLTYREELERPFIKVEEVKSSHLSYVKDWRGEVYIFSTAYSPEEESLIRSKALTNEVGTLNKDKFAEGKVPLSISYYLFPPVRDDGEYQHVNIKLADRHIFYRRVLIKIVDEKGIVENIYPHLPRFDIERRENMWIIEGLAPANSLVEVEMLLKGLGGLHFFEDTESVKAKVEEANRELMSISSLRNTVYNAMSFFLFVFPVFIFFIYKLFGKERAFTVPEFISFLPNPERKPWLVNMVFNGDATVTDENAYYATLLDLERKGFIEIKEEEGDLKIEIKRMDTEDPYERKVLLFLSKNITTEGFFSARDMEKRIREAVKYKDRGLLRSLKREIENIYSFSDRSIYSTMLDLRGFYIIRILGILTLLIVSGIVAYLHFLKKVYTYDIAVMGIFLIAVANIPHIVLPSQIFGRWKSNFYKERLEWESFKRFLSDLAMLKKYGKEDESMWREWLYYGTALGVADKIEEALSSLKINVPEIRKVRFIRRHTHYYWNALNEGLKSISSTPKSGGFGAGGGFGGGGAGGR